MKASVWILSTVGTILFHLVYSALLSGIFCLVKFLLSAIRICDAPSLKDFLWGGIAIYIFFLVYDIIKVVRMRRQFKSDSMFEQAFLEGLSWEEYQKIKRVIVNEEKYADMRWTPVDTRPTFEKGDWYRVYDSIDGKLHHVKVLGGIKGSDKLVKVLYDGDERLMLKSLIIENLERGKQAEQK